MTAPPSGDGRPVGRLRPPRWRDRRPTRRRSIGGGPPADADRPSAITGARHDHHSAAAGILSARGAPTTRPAAWPPRPGPGCALARLCGLAPPARLLRLESLEDVLRAGVVDALTTLALDIDDTLITERDGFGQPRPVELGTARVVRALQDAGVPIFGLTARPPFYRDIDVPRLTAGQLARCGIHLGRSAVLPGRELLPLRHPAAIHGGIAFCGDNSKGAVLAHLAAQLGIRRLAVLDDNLDHFRPLIEARLPDRLELTLVYYTGGLSEDEQAACQGQWWRLRLGMGWV